MESEDNVLGGGIQNEPNFSGMKSQRSSPVTRQLFLEDLGTKRILRASARQEGYLSAGNRWRSQPFNG